MTGLKTKFLQSILLFPIGSCRSRFQTRQHSWTVGHCNLRCKRKISVFKSFASAYNQIHSIALSFLNILIRYGKNFEKSNILLYIFNFPICLPIFLPYQRNLPSNFLLSHPISCLLNSFRHINFQQICPGYYYNNCPGQP